MAEDYLSPYATTSRFKPWKRRVFVFSKDAEAPAELAPWPVQLPPHAVWPEHLQDEPRQAFFDWFLSIEAASIAQVIKGFSLPSDAVGDPVALDEIGDRILDLIELSPEAERSRQKSLRKGGGGSPNEHSELTWMPIWNTIMIDLAHFVGAGIKTVYAKANPRWDLVEPQYKPFNLERYPFIRLDNAKTDTETQEDEAFFRNLLRSDLSLLEDTERWFAIIEKEFIRRGYDLSDVDYIAYRPECFTEPIGESAAFDPFFTLASFFNYAFMKRYDFKDPYGYKEEGFRSLGDILRPRDQAGWIGFPELSI